jgi:hypothetical protein
MQCFKCGLENPGKEYATVETPPRSIFICDACMQSFYTFPMYILPALTVGVTVLLFAIVPSAEELAALICFVPLIMALVTVQQIAKVNKYRGYRGGTLTWGGKEEVVARWVTVLAREADANRPLEYVRDDGWPAQGDGRCSDNACPCPQPGTLLPRGTGFLYVPEETVELRRQFREPEAARAEMKRKMAETSSQLGMPMFTTFRIGPILICELGARKRGLEMKVAAEDARHWWTSGEFPLRPTPHT